LGQAISAHVLILLTLLIFLLMGGCSKAAGRADYSAKSLAASLPYDGGWEGAGFVPQGPAGLEGQTPPAFRDMSNLYGEAAESGTTDWGTGQEIPAAEKDRKLIKNARIQTRVDNVEEAAAMVENMLARYDAYASSSSVRDTSRNYTLKIPGNYYETVLNELEKIGKTMYRSETVEDATIKYYDLDSRLQTKLELLKTFQSYLGKAGSIEEIMTVEKRIAELQQEIDWYGSQLAELSHLTNYATVNVELLGPASESAYYRPSLKDRIVELFRSFTGVVSTALVVIVGILIFGIPALLMLILLFWLLFGKVGVIRRIWRLAAARKE
jgi:hypothetical protein